jgi:hypothetical protein
MRDHVASVGFFTSAEVERALPWRGAQRGCDPMEEVRAIQAAREESAEKRKELVEQVKQLKAADDAGRLALLNTTMRAFQKEVERLSSRAMFAEAAFERLHEQASLNQGAQPATLQAAMTEKEELREKLEVRVQSNSKHTECACTRMQTACTRHAPFFRRSRRS